MFSHKLIKRRTPAMNTTVLLLLISMSILASCAPRAKDLERLRLVRRSPQYIKGQVPGIKGSPRVPPNPSLRKGEYMCGSKVCRLRPGEVPRGCDGVCQYRV